MVMHTRRLAMGIASYVPGVLRLANNRTGGSDSARYCYAVWMRHLCKAAGPRHQPVPHSLAELGPGDSLGFGLAAILSGTDTYLAFDVAAYADPERNLHVLDELIDLFQRREPIPGESEFPRVFPLDSYAFPHELIPEERLSASLDPARLEVVRALVAGTAGDSADGLTIRYEPAWTDISSVAHGAVQMICSQAVLEHVDALDMAYVAMRRWLAPGGLMSHQIDFTSHGTARVWNGHWTFSDREWRLVRGRRPWFLNRQPLSTHIELMRAHGFQVTEVLRRFGPSELGRERLAPRFAHLDDEDLESAGAFVQAITP
jgi:hypothetical protein